MSKNRKIKDTSPNVSSAGDRGGDRRREVLGVIGLGAALFLLVAMVSLQAGAMVMGPFGHACASLFYGLAGICGYGLIAVGAVAAVRTLLVRQPVMPLAIAAGIAIGLVALATLVHLAASGYRVAGHGPGGAIGEHLAEILRAVISTAGTAMLACVGLVVAVVVATPLRMRDVLHAIWVAMCATGRGLRAAVIAVARFWADVFRAILPERGDDEDDDVDVEIEVADDDVLEVGADDHVAEPLIIERTAPSPLAADADPEIVPLKKRKKSAGTELDPRCRARPRPSSPRRPRSLRRARIRCRNRAAAAWRAAPTRPIRSRRCRCRRSRRSRPRRSSTTSSRRRAVR